MQGLPSIPALKLMLDRDAPPPSRVAQTSDDAPVASRLLEGDLDAVVAKCLRKEANHRYETVSALKQDLKAHQRNEPVLAREGARLYVFGRLLRRYRWAVAAASVLIVTLGAGLAGTLWQARRAETQARTSAAVQGFLSNLFRANTSNQDDPVKARETTARELLDIGASKIDSSMRDAPEAKLSVVRLLGELYADLALDDETVRLRRQSLDLTRTLHGADSVEVAGALIDLAASMHASSAVNEREKVLQQATAILDRNGDSSSPIRADLFSKLAEHYQSVDVKRALDYAQQAVRVFSALPPSIDFAEALYMQGLTEQNIGQTRESLGSFSRAIEISREVAGFPNPSLPRFYAYLGNSEYRLQDFASAERDNRLALETAKAINGEDHVDTLQTEKQLGVVLFNTGRTREGLALLASAKQRALRIRGADDPFHTPQTQLENGNALVRAGLLEEGLADLQAAIANRRANRPGTLLLASMLEYEALALTDLGRYAQAHARLDEAGAIKTKAAVAARSEQHNFNTVGRIRLALAEQNVDLAGTLLAELYVDTTQAGALSLTALEQQLLSAEVDIAAGLASPASELARGAREQINASGLAAYMEFYTLRADFIEGEAALLEGNAAAALPLLQRTLSTRQKLLDRSSPRIAEAQIALAQCYLALGQPAQARELASAASATQAMHAQIGEHYRRPLHQLQARLTGTAG
jgi:serine/threonine-protein kinase